MAQEGEVKTSELYKPFSSRSPEVTSVSSILGKLQEVSCIHLSMRVCVPIISNKRR